MTNILYKRKLIQPIKAFFRSEVIIHDSYFVIMSQSVWLLIDLSDTITACEQLKSNFTTTTTIQTIKDIFVKRKAIETKFAE